MNSQYSPLQNLRECLSELITTLEKGNDPKACQEKFTAAIKEAWRAYQSGYIQVAIDALPRAMYLFATEELPNIISDPDEYQSILRELRLFERTMNKLVQPSEN